MAKNYYVRFTFDRKSIKVSRSAYDMILTVAVECDPSFSCHSNQYGYILSVSLSYFFYSFITPLPIL